MKQTTTDLVGFDFSDTVGRSEAEDEESSNIKYGVLIPKIIQCLIEYSHNNMYLKIQQYET